MPSLGMSETPKPKSWEEFEEMVRDLYALIWDDRETQRHGRTGQPQAGVDVYGQPAQSHSKYVGIQCKRFDKTPLTVKVIREELAKAKTFRPRISKFIIATTKSRDVAVQAAVRKINGMASRQKPFPVAVMFWEDLWNKLIEHQELLRKYYPEYFAVFSIPPLESPEVIQIVTERNSLKIEISKIEEKSIEERSERLRTQANAGYKESIRSAIADLVTEMEVCSAKMAINPELQGRVYRVAASIFLPNRVGGDEKQCRAYLDKAKIYSNGENLVLCQIIEALLVYLSKGLAPALTVIDGLENVEVERFRFSLYLENNNLAACGAIITKLSGKEDLRSKDWLRLLALYYASINDRAELDKTIDQLTHGVTQADEYVMLGLALGRFAHNHLHRFCSEYQVHPEFHIGLDLDDLVDLEAKHRASAMFNRAFELYHRNNCPSDALHALVGAVRLEMDAPQSSYYQTLLDQLQQVDPVHPLLLINRLRRKESIDVESLVQAIEQLLNDQFADPTIILALALEAGEDKSIARKAASLLQKHEGRFVTNEDLLTHFSLAVFDLRIKAGRVTRAKAWLSEMKIGSAYAHARAIAEFIFAKTFKHKETTHWIEEALLIGPRQPEVLAVATQFFHQQGAIERELDCAQRLFAILRTSQTAAMLFNALVASHHYGEFLEMAAQASDLHLDEGMIRRMRAQAWLRLEQLRSAQEEFEWLRATSKATVDELLNLARIHQYLSNQDEAFAVLHEAMRRFPDDPDTYMELSQAYLDIGNRDESYRWALNARNRFPDNSDVATHFFTNSFPTGFETRSEAAKAFSEFVPGGRFERTGQIHPASLEELKQLITAQQEHSANLESLYLKGQISSMMACYAQHFPLSQFHFVELQVRRGRFAAAGDQNYEKNWLKEHDPKEVALDYTAILTLWSLYDGNWLDILRQHFRQVWIPEHLLPLLFWEQRYLSKQGQFARYKAHTALRDNIVQSGSKFHLENAPLTIDRLDPLGYKSEQALATAHDLLYINEYPSDISGTVIPIGLNALAQVLEHKGEISIETSRRLTEHARQPTRSELELVNHFQSGSDVVVDLSTLIQLTLAAALNPFCNFLGGIYLSHSAWQRLQSEIAAFELREQIATDLRRLRNSLRQGLNEDFIQTESLLPTSRLLLLDHNGAGEPDSEDISKDELLHLMFSYIDDLVGIAHSHQMPLWTDDRWTSKLFLEQRPLPFIFGTDTFLEWRRAEKSEPESSFSNYGRLIEWRYLGLPLNPDYLLWLLNRGIASDAKLISNAIALPREYLVDFWKATQTTPELSNDFGVRLLTVYNEGTTSLMRKCYEQNVPQERCAALFEKFDLTRHAPQTEGREPHYFASLVLHAISNDFPYAEPLQDDQNQGTMVFSRWLDEVLQLAKVEPQLICEAWHIIVQQPIKMFEQANNEQEKQIAFLFTRRLFRMAPDHVRTSLVKSDLGDKLREYFGLRLQKVTILEYSTSTGTHRVSFPEETWAQDLHTATIRFVDQPSSGVVTSGSVTIRASWLKPGSIFLRREEFPTDVYRQHGDVSGAQRVVCVLPAAIAEGRDERLQFWKQGLVKLESLGIPTDEWIAMKQRIEIGDSAVGIDAGMQLLSYLLGQWRVARDYLQEAVQVGPSALEFLLSYLTPQVIRAWIGMPSLEWGETADPLSAWAQAQANLQIDSLGRGNNLHDSLDNTFSRFGYSIFPDAKVWRHALAEFSNSLDSKGRIEIIDAALSLAERSASETLKANALLFVLGSEDAYVREDATISRTREILASMAFAQAGEDSKKTCSRLGRTLSYSLFTSWRVEDMFNAVSSRELAYLGFIAAGYISDTLAEHDSNSSEFFEALTRELEANCLQLWMTADESNYQPVGIYKPKWARYLNYALGYFTGNFIVDHLPQENVRINSIARSIILNEGIVHRILQTAMQNITIEGDWLDSLIPSDFARTVGNLLATTSDENLNSWPPEELDKLGTCLNPDAGSGFVPGYLHSLDTNDVGDITRLVGMVFLAEPVWNEHAYELVATVLTPESLEHIYRFPVAYGELIWHLLQLLSVAHDLPSALNMRVREVTFGVPTGRDNISELIEIQATTFARMIQFGHCNSDIETWLLQLGANEKLSIHGIRQGVLPFVRMWDYYSPETRLEIGNTLHQLVEIPRLSGLWELKRVNRDFNQLQH